MRRVSSEQAEEAAARVMTTLAYGQVVIGLDLPERLLPPRAMLLGDPRHSMVLPHIVAIAEEYSRALLVAGSEASMDPTMRLMLDLWNKDGRRRAEGPWPQHREAWKQWYDIDFTDCPDWLAVATFNEARNAIMHGLGRLTPRQLRKDGGKAIVEACALVGIVVRAGTLLISDSALVECARACRGFVFWLDSESQDAGIAA